MIVSNSVIEKESILRLNKSIDQIGINPEKFFTLTGIIQTGDQLSAMLRSSVV